MRCRKCDYELFGCPPGPCPECGLAFSPLEFRFKPGAVEFLCPKCGGVNGGYSREGLPSGETIECDQCREHVCPDAMTVRLPEGLCAEDVMAPAVPSRHQEDDTAEYVRSVLRSIRHPVLFVREAEASHLHGAAFPFAFGIYSMTTVGASGVAGVFFGVTDRYDSFVAVLIQAFLFTLIVLMMLAAIHLCVVLPLMAACVHLSIAAMGARSHGYRVTLRTIYYGQAPVILGAGLVTAPIAALWCAGSIAAMLTETQRVSLGVALLAVLMPVIAVMSLYAWMAIVLL